jgi:hypothetical protein
MKTKIAFVIVWTFGFVLLANENSELSTSLYHRDRSISISTHRNLFRV